MAARRPPSSASSAPAQGAIGPLLAAWGLASMLGGAVAVRRGAPREPIRRLVALFAALAATDALLLAATDEVALEALLVVAGPAVAPAFAVVYTLAGDVARGGTVTEAFTWLGTGIGLGLAAGSARAAHSRPRAARGPASSPRRWAPALPPCSHASAHATSPPDYAARSAASLSQAAFQPAAA
jgi:hypothetical protein